MPNLSFKLDTVIKICVLMVSLTAAVVLVKADVRAVDARVDQHDREITAMKSDDKELATAVVLLKITIAELTAAVKHAHDAIVNINEPRAFPAPATFAADGTDYPLTLSEVSAQVGRHPDTVVRWLNERKVDVLKRKTHSGEYRFSHEDLAKFLAYATHVPVTEEP